MSALQRPLSHGDGESEAAAAEEYKFHRTMANVMTELGCMQVELAAAQGALHDNAQAFFEMMYELYAHESITITQTTSTVRPWN